MGMTTTGGTKLLLQKLIKRLKHIYDYFPKNIRFYSMHTIPAKYNIVELKLWLHKNSRC
jgi:hypothetical protein